MPSGNKTLSLSVNDHDLLLDEISEDSEQIYELSEEWNQLGVIHED